MSATVEHGQATKVRGDPDHPFTKGGLCVKVNDYTNRVYSADRVLYPLRRIGAKGEGRFEQISWDAALDEIATRLQSIIDRDGGQAILPYSYLGTEGILNGLTVGDPFFHGLGATVSERTFCDSAACTAYAMTIGVTAGLDPESFVHSRYIVLWACNVRSTNLHMWPFIKEAQQRGAKVVVIDPMRHRTAADADWHIPIRPGTDGALALAMMNVIVNQRTRRHELRAELHRRLRGAGGAGPASTRRSGHRRSPASRSRTSSRWRPSTPRRRRRRSASVSPSNATPAAVRRSDRSPACRPSSAPGATSVAACCSSRCGPSRSTGEPSTPPTRSGPAAVWSTSSSSDRP